MRMHRWKKVTVVGLTLLLWGETLTGCGRSSDLSGIPGHGKWVDSDVTGSVTENVVLYAKITRAIMLEGYATVQEMAEKWGLNERTVQTMCATGKIEGLAKFGRSWAIPKDTEKPTDNRVKSGAYKDWRKKYAKKKRRVKKGAYL